MDKSIVKIKIIYDNLRPPPEIIEKNLQLSEIKGHHGFSAYIEYRDKKIIFDTGWNGIVFMRNCKLLDIPLKEIDALIISHNHWDHAGGIAHLLENYDIPQIYFPKGYSLTQIREIKSHYNVPLIQRIDDFQVLDKISCDIASTGTLNSDIADEQSLLIKYGENGETLLMIGCAHAGLKSPIMIGENMMGTISAICGGVHGFNDRSFLEKAVRNGLKHAFVGHCTQHFDIFEDIEGFLLTKIYTTMEIIIGSN